MRMPKEIRAMEHRTRWAIVPTTKDQLLSSHSYFVAMYSMWIVDHILTEEWLGKVSRDKVIEAALLHDLEETFTGDIVSPVKKEMLREGKESYKRWEKEIRDKWFGESFYQEPDDEVKAVVSVADVMESAAYIGQELFQGNAELAPIYEHLVDVLTEVIGARVQQGVLDRKKVFYIWDHVRQCEYRPFRIIE